jgi:acetyl-CoA carboxylase biotin carboxyl carrier protein
MDWKQLKELIELVSEKGFAEFEVERQGFRLRISNGSAASAAPRESARPAPAPAEAPPAGSSTRPPAEGHARALPAASSSSASGQTPTGSNPNLRTIKSPIVGTFYRGADPASPPFVSVGDRVQPDTVVCIIEAMKLMNEIPAELHCEIVQIYVDNATAVEYDQPLFEVKLLS